MANFLSKLFGTKSDRDLKEVKPMLDATLKVYPEIQKLSNDELRAKTLEFKARINKEVEANLVPEWEDLRGKKFIVYDGNHRLKIWGSLIKNHKFSFFFASL